MAHVQVGACQAQIAEQSHKEVNYQAHKSAAVQIWLAYLKKPDMPVLVQKKVKAKELKAIWEGEEGELMAHCLHAFACSGRSMIVTRVTCVQ